MFQKIVPLFALLLLISCGGDSSSEDTKACTTNTACALDQECKFTSVTAQSGTCVSKQTCKTAKESCSDLRICDYDGQGELVCGGTALTFGFSTGEKLTDGKQSVAYSAKIELTGITGPYTIKLASGSAALPAGLQLSSDGTLSGTPTQAGAFSLDIEAFNGAANATIYYGVKSIKKTFALTITQGSTDPCDGITCSNHGTCVVNNNAASCNCDAGYVANGVQCVEEGTDLCKDITCSGHGTCQVVNNNATCNCEAGYTANGTECIEDTTDPCDGITCSGHGTCVVDNNAATCNCDTGYTANGTECIEDLNNPCNPNPCDGTSDPYLTVCTVNNDQAVCSCIEGYTEQNGKCIKDEVDPCEGIDCSGHGTCVVDNEAATCNCDSGYVANGTTCVEEQTTPINAGDLIITEIMSNPAFVSDTNGEWLEIYNTTQTTLSLNGLMIVRTDGNSYTVEDGAEIQGESYAVIAKKDAETAMLPVVDVIAPISLTGTNTTLSLKIGETVIDTVDTSDQSGISWQRDMSEGTWCESTTAISDTNTDLGTPGAANGSCEPVVDPCEGITCGENEVCDGGDCVCDTGYHDENGTCVADVVDPCNGVTCGENATCSEGVCACDAGYHDDNGACVPDSSGDTTLIITEVMSDPSTASDTVGDWIEIYNTTDAAINLAGFKVQKEDVSPYTLSSGGDYNVPAKSYFVIARANASSAMLPQVDAEISNMSLTNSDGVTLKIMIDTEVLDTVVYDTKTGVSWQRDMSSGAWCESTALIATNAEKGTPGSENSSCQ